MFHKDYGNGNENPIAFQLQGQKLIYLSVYIVPYLDLPWLWSHRQSIPQKAHSSALSCLRTTGAERRKWMENEGLAFILFLPTEWGQLHVKVIGRAEQAFPLYSFHITLNFHIMDLKVFPQLIISLSWIQHLGKWNMNLAMFFKLLVKCIS